MNCDTAKTFACFAQDLYEILILILPILAGAGVVMFFWGLVMFLNSEGNEANLTKGKTLMLWGIIGIFVMVSVYAILSIMVATFGWDFALPQLRTT